MPEWSNGAVSKTVVRLRVPRVRIPLSPPYFCLRFAAGQPKARAPNSANPTAAPFKRLRTVACWPSTAAGFSESYPLEIAKQIVSHLHACTGGTIPAISASSLRRQSKFYGELDPFEDNVDAASDWLTGCHASGG